MPNWKAKRSNNFEQRNKGFTTNQKFGHNNSRKIPNKIFQGNNFKGNSQQNPTIQGINNLQIITATMLKIMNVRNR